MEDDRSCAQGSASPATRILKSELVTLSNFVRQKRTRPGIVGAPVVAESIFVNELQLVAYS